MYNGERRFCNGQSANISKKVVGVFPANEKKKNEFNDISIKMKYKGAKYSFMIVNTDSADKDWWHWWSFLDIDGEDPLVFSTLLDGGSPRNNY